MDACLSDAREIIGRTVTTGVVLADIDKDNNFYDQSAAGATFSGGGPLMQTDLLHACPKSLPTASSHGQFSGPSPG